MSRTISSALESYMPAQKSCRGRVNKSNNPSRNTSHKANYRHIGKRASPVLLHSNPLDFRLMKEFTPGVRQYTLESDVHCVCKFSWHLQLAIVPRCFLREKTETRGCAVLLPPRLFKSAVGFSNRAFLRTADLFAALTAPSALMPSLPATVRLFTVDAFHVQAQREYPVSVVVALEVPPILTRPSLSFSVGLLPLAENA